MITNRGGRTLIGSLLMLPFSVVLWGATLSWMGLVFFVMFPVTLVIPFERFQVWFHILAGLPVRFAGCRVRVHEDPNYSRDQVVMFAQNHVSMLDGCIALSAVKVPMCGLENAAHLNLPGYGWLLRAANAIPVRKGPGKFAAIEQAIADRKSRGISVLTFPEAHRTEDGKVRPFKRGIFRIARDAGLPIVPIAVRGAYRLFPKGAMTLRPALLDIYIGPPLQTKGLSDKQLTIAMERVREVMVAWTERHEMAGELCLKPIDENENHNELAAEG